MTNHGSFSLGGNSSATIQPGIYSSISVSGNARLTMASGIYIIEGGGFSVSGNASVTGSGVTIVNGGSNYPGTGGTYGSITQGGNSTINLSPVTSGPYAGIVFFQPLDNTNALTVSGNASGITGTIYAPGAALSESGNAALHASLIVDTLTISGNGIANGPSKAGPAGTGESGLLIGVVDLNTTSTKSSTGKNGQNAARTVVLNGVSSPSAVDRGLQPGDPGESQPIVVQCHRGDPRSWRQRRRVLDLKIGVSTNHHKRPIIEVSGLTPVSVNNSRSERPFPVFWFLH